MALGDKMASEVMRPDFASSGYSFKAIERLAGQWQKARG